MDSLNDILTTVNEISQNNSSIGEQINMISEKYGVNHKVSTVLHFASKDGDWNPTALEMLSEITSELPIKEVNLKSNDKKESDFYMVNYLNDNWREQIIFRMRRYEELSFFNVWMRGITGMVIQDLKKMKKYPIDETDFIVNRHFPGDGMVYDVVSDWYDDIYDGYIKTKNS
jgi:hypothetical protein|tara:strand:- start:706 stop:1221 length:516 start_codon:yes stop_codon:yes gene_type:complete